MVADPSYQKSLVQKAKTEKLWKRRPWRKLLFIPDYWTGSGKSLIDSPNFFVDPQGRTDPDKELIATLKGIFVTDPPLQKDADPKHVLCQFPARVEWLTRVLAIPDEKIPKIDCKKRDQFIGFASYEKLSLVFSNYFLNSPASMFGHTFFRLHRAKNKNSVSDEGLLDDILNFSAFVPPVVHPLWYVVGGLVGGFVGKFSLVPYYHKLQEYNNYESRDLWEYELNLEKKHLENLARVLWEISRVHIDYYYLDENCSYVLLAVLEAINPDYYLTGNFNYYAIPADTLRVVTRHPKNIRKVSYRPSIMAKYLGRANHLSSSEKDILEEIIREEKSEIGDAYFSECDKACESRVIDAALDYIDFEERLFGHEQPKKYPKLRVALLKRRSKIAIKPLPISTPPPRQRPDKGHMATRLGLMAGDSNLGGQFVSFNWRPALHDIGARSDGYANEMQIAFMDTWFEYDRNTRDLFLERFKLLEIVSLSGSVPLVNSMAWHVNLGYETYRLCDGNLARCHRYYLQVGFGKSYHLIAKRLFVFLLLHGDFGFSNELGQGFHAGPVAWGGFLWEILPWLKLTSTANVGRYFASNTVDRLRAETSLSVGFSQNWEFRLFFENEMAGQNKVSNQLGLQVFSYF